MEDTRKSEAMGASGQRRVLFSIIVPVYEQWDLVPLLLSCIRSQAYQLDDVELILVDNGSAAVVIPSDLPPNTRVLFCVSAGSYAARNMGAAEARGEWLVFTDADCRPVPGWLVGLNEKIDHNADTKTLVAGAVDVVSQVDKPNVYEIYDMVRGIPQARYVWRGYAATANLTVSREQFRRLGGFDEGRFSGGDAEFCRRARASGLGITYVPGASVRHPARNTWHELSTKARRVKGGQLAAGSVRRRLAWLLATLLPPVRESYYLLQNRQYSLAYRLIAVAVQHRLWLVEIAELFRLSSGGRPERR